MRTPTRALIIEQLTARLSMPRVQISIMLALTAFAAFITSAILLRLDMTSMAIRYPIAVIVGYCVFLVLLRIWIWTQSDEPVGDVSIDGVGDLLIPNINIGGGSGQQPVFGGGGDFAGAGAGSGWSEGDTPAAAPVGLMSGSSSGGSSSGSGGIGGIDVDLDDGVALLVVLVVLVLVFSALIYVVWIAPILFAELIIDAAVVGSLYRPIRNIERRHWLMTALRKTAIPAVIITILFAIAGFVMQAAEPDAVTIGQFLNAVL